MMYFWAIPVLLLAALFLFMMFYGGRKRHPIGRSRLDEARTENGSGDLHD